MAGIDKLGEQPKTSPLVEALAGRAWNDALEVAAKVAEHRIQAGRADSIPEAIRALIFEAALGDQGHDRSTDH